MSAMNELVLKLTADGINDARGVIAPDGNEVFSVYDILSRAYTNKDPAGTARKEFHRLIADGSDFKEEVSASCYYIKFPGQGQRETPCMTIRGLQRLILIMKGKVSEIFRKMVEDVFTKVVGGDTSLIEVIQFHAASNAPVQQMYRRALAQEPVQHPISVSQQSAVAVPSSDEIVRKRQLDREDTLFEMEMAERKQAMAERNQGMAERKQKLMQQTVEDYAALCPNKVIDDRAKLLFKDNILNIFTMAPPARGQLAIAAEPQLAIGVVAPPVNLNKPITISTLAVELGHRFDSGQLQKIGKRVASAYREKYGESPGRHEQLVGQASILVNSYTERDRGLMEKVIVDFINE